MYVPINYNNNKKVRKERILEEVKNSYYNVHIKDDSYMKLKLN